MVDEYDQSDCEWCPCFVAALVDGGCEDGEHQEEGEYDFDDEAIACRTADTAEIVNTSLRYESLGQTYKGRQRYYREHRASRSHGECPSRGGSIPCSIPDEQIGRMFSSIVLPDDWERRVLAKIVHQDETARIIAEREKVNERLKRLGKAFVDGLFDEIEYHRQKKSMEWELKSLLIPGVDAAKEAGRLLEDMPRLWAGANLQEQHQLLTTVLDAVYIDMKDSKSIVSVKAKPAFRTAFGVAGAHASTARASEIRKT